jgi:hypothetical protein
VYRSDCNPKLGMQQRTCIPSVTWLWAISKSLRGIAPIHFVPNAALVLLYIVLVPRGGLNVRGRSASQSETNRMHKCVHPRKKIFGFQGSRQCRDPAEHKEDIDRWITSPCQRRRGRRKRGAVAIDEGYLDVRGGRRRACRLGWGRKERWSLESELGWNMESNRIDGHRVWVVPATTSLAFSSMA